MKNNKLMALVVAFAMILSMMVIPASASDGTLSNLLVDENPGFEDGTISSAQSANAATVEAAAARTGNYGAKVTGSGSVSNLNYPYKSRNPEEGKYFRAGVWVKAAFCGKMAGCRSQY